MAEDRLAEALRVVLEEFGDEVVADRRRLRSLLRDVLGDMGEAPTVRLDVTVRVLDLDLVEKVRNGLATQALGGLILGRLDDDVESAEDVTSTLEAALSGPARVANVRNQHPTRSSSATIEHDATAPEASATRSMGDRLLALIERQTSTTRWLAILGVAVVAAVALGVLVRSAGTDTAERDAAAATGVTNEDGSLTSRDAATAPNTIAELGVSGCVDVPEVERFPGPFDTQLDCVGFDPISTVRLLVFDDNTERADMLDQWQGSRRGIDGVSRPPTNTGSCTEGIEGEHDWTSTDSSGRVQCSTDASESEISWLDTNSGYIAISSIVRRPLEDLGRAWTSALNISIDDNQNVSNTPRVTTAVTTTSVVAGATPVTATSSSQPCPPPPSTMVPEDIAAAIENTAERGAYRAANPGCDLP